VFSTINAIRRAHAQLALLLEPPVSSTMTAIRRAHARLAGLEPPVLPTMTVPHSLDSAGNQ
jgi:hypothetical protein